MILNSVVPEWPDHVGGSNHRIWNLYDGTPLGQDRFDLDTGLRRHDQSKKESVLRYTAKHAVFACNNSRWQHSHRERTPFTRKLAKPDGDISGIGTSDDSHVRRFQYLGDPLAPILSQPGRDRAPFLLVASHLRFGNFRREPPLSRQSEDSSPLRNLRSREFYLAATNRALLHIRSPRFCSILWKRPTIRIEFLESNISPKQDANFSRYFNAPRTELVNLPDSRGAPLTLLKHKSSTTKTKNFMAYFDCGYRISDRTRKNPESLTSGTV